VGDVPLTLYESNVREVTAGCPPLQARGGVTPAWGGGGPLPLGAELPGAPAAVGAAGPAPAVPAAVPAAAADGPAADGAAAAAGRTPVLGWEGLRTPVGAEGPEPAAAPGAAAAVPGAAAAGLARGRGGTF
jgi:hypothetical protein